MPVWANDAETGEVLHRSAAASELFASEDGKSGPRYVQEFFADPEANQKLAEELLEKGQVEAARAELERARERAAEAIVRSPGRGRRRC